jgi:transcriptional regulator with XRE-family HTH domain
MTTLAIPDAEYARQLTDRIKVAVEGTWHLITEAYQSRAWSALGYGSWDDYCTREFGTSRLRLPREDRAETVQSLREAGLSIRAIAAVTGDSFGTVQAVIAGDQIRSPEREQLLAEELAASEEAFEAEQAENDDFAQKIADEMADSGDPWENGSPGHEAFVTELQASEARSAAPALVKVVGRDGKAYPASSTRTPNRRALPDVAKVAGFELRQAMDRVLRVFEDNRYRTNEEQVTTALRGHLLYVAETVAAVLDQLP